jgi:hypothetical protein
MSTTETELRQLRARVRTLEDELEAERRGTGRSSVRGGVASDEWGSLADRKVDELSRLFTGTVRATLEGFRVAADSASYFVEDVLERNVPERSESPSDVARRLPTDLASGVARSLNRTLDIPSRAIERFHASYQEETRPGRRQRRRAQAPPPDNYETWTKQELYERASALGIEGRSEMTKSELAEAIRGAQSDLENLSKADLYELARDREIEGRSEMTRDELVAALQAEEARPTD